MQCDAVEACWAHNSDVGGSKPLTAIIFIFIYKLINFLIIGIYEFEGATKKNRPILNEG